MAKGKPTGRGKSRAAGASYRKTTLRPRSKKTPLKESERAHTEHLFMYQKGVTKPCLDAAFGTVANKSSCMEVVPIQITNDFSTNWNRFIKDKYEQYRIASVQVKLLFNDVKTPAFFIIEQEETPLANPSQIINDPAHGSKQIKEGNNSLVLSWKPQKKSNDYDYKAVGNIGADAPLAYIKVLQHELDSAVGSSGCHMEVKITVACKGLKNPQGAPLTAGQLNNINTAMGN